MTLSIGENSEFVFQKCVKEVIEKVKTGKLSSPAFGFLEPKSITEIFNIYSLQVVGFYEKFEDQFVYKIDVVYSFSAVLGFLEGIPFIGSALAIINALGHYILKNQAEANLKDYVVRFGNSPLDHMNILNEKISYYFHGICLNNSLLSIVPTLKPILRIAEGAFYYIYGEKVKSA